MATKVALPISRKNNQINIFIEIEHQETIERYQNEPLAHEAENDQNLEDIKLIPMASSNFELGLWLQVGELRSRRTSTSNEENLQERIVKSS